MSNPSLRSRTASERAALSAPKYGPAQARGSLMTPLRDTSTDCTRRRGFVSVMPCRPSTPAKRNRSEGAGSDCHCTPVRHAQTWSHAVLGLAAEDGRVAAGKLEEGRRPDLEVPMRAEINTRVTEPASLFEELREG